MPTCEQTIARFTGQTSLREIHSSAQLTARGVIDSLRNSIDRLQTLPDVVPLWHSIQR